MSKNNCYGCGNCQNGILDPDFPAFPFCTLMREHHKKTWGCSHGWRAPGGEVQPMTFAERRLPERR